MNDSQSLRLASKIGSDGERIFQSGNGERFGKTIQLMEMHGDSLMTWPVIAHTGGEKMGF